jgi:hypothetical protein
MSDKLAYIAIMASFLPSYSVVSKNYSYHFWKKNIDKLDHEDIIDEVEV